MPAIDKVLDLGLVAYREALQRQLTLFEEIKAGSLGCGLVFCRHHPVITLGRQAQESNLKKDSRYLSGKGIEVFSSERGGDVTYHGPGQLLVYPVLHLRAFRKDIHLYLRKLEETVIGVLSEFGIDGESRKGLTGVWVNGRKISSIGICVRNWISYHGVALNVEAEDLDNFSLIRPCGMDIEMASMEGTIGRKVPFSEIQQTFTRRFEYA